MFAPADRRVARDEEVAHHRPRAGAVDEDVAGFEERDRLRGVHLAEDPLDRPGRARVDQLAEGALDRVQGDEPLRPCLQQRSQVGGDGAAVRQARLELDRVEDRLDALPVDRVRLVALDRVGDQELGERHHPGPRVRVSPLVETDGLPLDRLEERRQEQADRSCPQDMDPAHRSRGRDDVEGG